MRSTVAKKIHRAARRAADEAARSRPVRAEVSWWARPRVFRAWVTAGAWCVRVAMSCGWRDLGRHWKNLVMAAPRRGVRLVVVVR